MHEPCESYCARIDKKTWSLSILAGTMTFTFFAGMHTDTAVEGLVHARTEYRWPVDFALRPAFVVVAFHCGLSPLKRAKLDEEVRA